MRGLSKGNKSSASITTEHRINPFLGLHQAVDEAMKDFYHLFESPDFERLENRNLFPAMDIVEASDHYTIEIEMPGMGEEDINVSINNNQLIIKGEKSTSKKHKDKNYLSREIKYGSYERVIDLPLAADAEKASATFKKGMLWIKIPKKAGSKNNARKIKIEKAQ
ncbi:Hsp20/alpha crystallin family protein [Legionella gresilensis]|uniref:Hsp20/alpha crystallin family protein n=1 Tax=Legionella gresilensis TaxID=91823 RepID=UPI001040E50C|nr:Hsp20/alpha crystallin family protein [Legionella gresilensis]